MSGPSGNHKRSNPRPKGALRAKSGCYTCRIRRKKCDEKPNEEGACQTCVRLRLQCLGYGAKRPDWMREGNSVAEIREKIKNFLAENGMIKGHSGPASLRPAGSSSSPPGASASLTATSPLGTSFPLSQGMVDQGTGDLSTPLSTTSTLTPEDRSSSPISPPGSRIPSNTYASDRPFPPNYVHSGARPHYEQGGDSSIPMLQQTDLPSSPPGVLLLSNGRPIPSRTQSQVGRIRHSRRTPHSGSLGPSIPNGLGLFAMDQPDLDGQGSTISNVNTLNSPYINAPQLSPDSPRPPPRSDPLMGAYTSSQIGGQVLGDSHGYAGHAPGQFTLHPGNVRHGAVGSSSYNYAHSNGYSHDQNTTGSSWPTAGHVRDQHQDQLLNQQQGQLESQNPHQWTQTVRHTDMPPPNVQSSFGPLYHFQGDYSIDSLTIGDIETFDAQQTPIGDVDVNSIGDGALIPMYTAQTQAPINEEAFLGLSRDDQQRAYQEYAFLQLLQPALVDPMHADRTDRSLVDHYLRYVRPVQYFFLDDRVVDLLRSLALTNDAVRNAICSVASVHKRQMREGSTPLRGQSSQGASRRSPLALIESISDAPEGDEGIDYYTRTQLALTRAGNASLTEAEAMAGLQCISSFLFAGGLGEWDFFLGVACRWVETILAFVDGDYLQDLMTEMRRSNELRSFIVRTTMWFEVLASITIVREPKFLSVYRTLFAADCARIIEIDGSSIRNEAEFSMLEVMGCDNLTFLAIAEISALAAWKEKEIEKQTLSFVELAERKSRIEETCLRALAEVDMNVYRGGTAQQDDSLENRRRLTADIFRASARLYFHTVLSGDKPGVKEIRQGVIETIDALRRVPTEPKSLRRSVVRSVVFPICLAGCMTDEATERDALKQLLESEGGAGNCGSVVAVMETVWERRDRQRKNAARGGRRSEFEADVSWREVLRERGGGMPILLV